MFLSLIIKLFQAHPETRFDFSPGVNAIIGDPDKGKTSTIRALRLLTFNRPSGAPFYPNYKNGKVDTEIEAVFDNGKTNVVKSLTKDKEGKSVLKSTDYHYGDYSKVGTDVPDKVRELINLDELNFQNQLDKPFLVTSTGGEIAKYINKITKLDGADEWISNLTTTANKTKTEIDILKSNAAELAIQLKRYDCLDELEELVKSLKTIDSRRTRIINQLSDLERLQERRNELNTQLNFLYEQREAEKYLIRAQDTIKDLSKCEEKISLLQRYDQITSLISHRMNDTLIPLQKIFDTVSKMELSVISEKLTSLQSLHSRYIEICDSIEKDKARLLSLEDEYTNVLKENGICPVCFSEIDAEAVERMLENL